MFIVFLLFLYVQTAYCQTTTLSSNFVYNCSFLNNTYSSNAAVFDQFHFNNHTSIILTASYAFLSSSIFELGLIYQFSTSNYFVPFPVIFDCASIVRSCQLKTMAGTTMISRDSEPINVQLTPFNYSTTSVQFNQMGLYLKQGQYQLSNCILNNGQQMTDPESIFYIKIQYEKSVGTSCDPLSDTCGSPFLTTCSSSTCTCLSSSSLVSYSDSFYCADVMNISNCKIFPSRCITWCNSTTNFLCICPSDTLKIQRNNLFVCELPVNSNNCSNDDNLRRCSLGQCCTSGQCIDCSMTTTTSKRNDLNDSIDERLRIALGVIAGLLGTSVLILLGVFCWLRQRQKRRRITAEKSLASSSNSSASSLYISPIQRQQQQQGKVLPSIYHLPYTDIDDEKKSQIFHRTDSFRQAVLSGNRQTKMIEHVSTKRDSFSYQKDGWSSPTYSTLEFIVPSITNPNSSVDLDRNNTNVYQIIIPSSPPILTHAV